MNKYTLSRILQALKDASIEFKQVLFEKMEDFEFTFASNKNIINHGIYYLANIDDIKPLTINNSIIISNKYIETSNHLIVVSNPQLVHYKLSSILAPPPIYEIAVSSKISTNAKIDKLVSIGENCVLGNCIIEKGVIIKHNVIIEDNVIIKENTFIDSNSVIGAGGIAWIWDEDGTRVMQPQSGGVIIEENCILATDITIVKGSLSENTLIGKGTVIAHGTKIGHGAQISNHVHMANNVSIAGNAIVGSRCFLGSASVISSNVIIAPNCIIGAGAVVNKNHLEEYCTLVGVPAIVINKENFIKKPNGAPIPFKANKKINKI